MPPKASGSRPRGKSRPKSKAAPTDNTAKMNNAGNAQTQSVEIDPSIFGLSGDKFTIQFDPNMYDDDPELKAKSEKMELFTVDYDPKSTTYKVDFCDRRRSGPGVKVDHTEPEAPFAVGFRKSGEIKQAMDMIWGDRDAEYETLHALYDDLHPRVQEQRRQCLDLYDKHGARCTSHTKFHDTYRAYLFLSAKASACTQLQQIRYWSSTFSLQKGSEQFLDFLQRLTRSTTGTIASRVVLAKRCIEDGDKKRCTEDEDKYYQDAGVEEGPSEGIGQHYQAAQMYVQGLAMLSPWLANDWWMLPSEDTQGLSDVEIELHLRLAKCAFAFEMKDLASLHIRAVLSHGFATNGQIARASMLQIQNLEIEKSGPEFHFSHLDIVKDLIWNAKTLAAFAKIRPADEKWHVQYNDFSLEEKIRRLRGLGAIMPLLYGV